MTYRLVRENFQIDKKVSENDLINKAFEDGLQNGCFDIISVFDSLDEARTVLKNYKTNWHKQETWATGWIWILELYYIEEIDEDGEPTGNYDY